MGTSWHHARRWRVAAAALVVLLVAGGLVVATSGGRSDDASTEGDPVELVAPMGLTSTEQGYTIEAGTTAFQPGVEAPFRFRITAPDGTVLRDYRLEHERDLHLIVVSRDLMGFQHVHPERATDGTWEVPLTLPSAGPYRAYADFVPAGGEDGLTLGLDLTAAGEHRPQDLPVPARMDTIGGYRVAVEGTLGVEREAELAFRIDRAGAPVDDLDPYLGAYGHLVAIRTSDLAYLHVHPTGEPGDGSTPPGPEVNFAVHVPTAGDYRLFLDFSHGGEVRTAAFTAQAVDAASGGDTGGQEQGNDHDSH